MEKLLNHVSLPEKFDYKLQSANYDDNVQFISCNFRIKGVRDELSAQVRYTIILIAFEFPIFIPD